MPAQLEVVRAVRAVAPGTRLREPYPLPSVRRHAVGVRADGGALLPLRGPLVAGEPMGNYSDGVVGPWAMWPGPLPLLPPGSALVAGAGGRPRGEMRIEAAVVGEARAILHVRLLGAGLSQLNSKVLRTAAGPSGTWLRAGAFFWRVQA